jgi:small subunit ribosomal protein S6e
MQIVVGANDGTTHSFELDDEQQNAVEGLSVGDTFDGSAVGLDGYKLKITGGSDEDGFPMKQQLQGTGRKKILIDGGLGVNDLEKGERKRKSLRGNTVADDIAQLNCGVTEEGDEDIDTLLHGDNDEETEDDE